MPRFVRPSWFSLAVDNNGNAPSIVRETGPRSRTGTTSCNVKVRSAGAVLDLLDVDAIGSADGASVLVTVTDKRSGKVVFSERFTQ